MKQKKKITRISTKKRLEQMVVTDNIHEDGRLNVPTKLIMEYFKEDIIKTLRENDGRFPKPKPRKPVPRSYAEYKKSKDNKN